MTVSFKPGQLVQPIDTTGPATRNVVGPRSRGLISYYSEFYKTFSRSILPDEIGLFVGLEPTALPIQGYIRRAFVLFGEKITMVAVEDIKAYE